MPIQQRQLCAAVMAIGWVLAGSSFESQADEVEDWKTIFQILKEKRENPDKKVDTTKILKERADKKAARDKQFREQQKRANTSSIPLSDLGIRQESQSRSTNTGSAPSTWPGTPQPRKPSNNQSLYSTDRYQPASPQAKKVGTESGAPRPAGFSKSYASGAEQRSGATRSANRSSAGIDDLSAEDETIHSTRQPTSIDLEYISCEEYEAAGIDCGKSTGPIFGIP